MPGANPHLEHLMGPKMRLLVPGPDHRLEFAVGEFVKVTVAPSVLATISGLIGSKPQRSSCITSLRSTRYGVTLRRGPCYDVTKASEMNAFAAASISAKFPLTFGSR